MVYSAGCRSPARLVLRPASQAADARVDVDTVSCHSRSMPGDGAGGAEAADAVSRLRAAQDAEGDVVPVPLCWTATRSALRAPAAGSPVLDHHADTWASMEGAVGAVVVVVATEVLGELAAWDSATGWGGPDVLRTKATTATMAMVTTSASATVTTDRGCRLLRGPPAGLVAAGVGTGIGSGTGIGTADTGGAPAGVGTRVGSGSGVWTAGCRGTWAGSIHRSPSQYRRRPEFDRCRYQPTGRGVAITGLVPLAPGDCRQRVASTWVGRHGTCSVWADPMGRPYVRVDP